METVSTVHDFSYLLGCLCATTNSFGCLHVIGGVIPLNFRSGRRWCTSPKCINQMGPSPIAIGASHACCVRFQRVDSSSVSALYCTAPTLSWGGSAQRVESVHHRLPRPIRTRGQGDTLQQRTCSHCPKDWAPAQYHEQVQCSSSFFSRIKKCSDAGKACPQGIACMPDTLRLLPCLMIMAPTLSNLRC